MRMTESVTRLAVFILVLAAAVAVFSSGDALAASAAANPQALADSLTRKAAGGYATEPTVQEILDQVGWGLSATADEVPLSSLCAGTGPVTVRLVAEYSGLANDGRLLWYPAGAKSDTTELLAGIAAANDSTVFQLNSVTNLAWLYSPRSGVRWYSETQYNYDQRRHVKVYPGPVQGTFLLFWEDLAWLADGDFNDMVVLVTIDAPNVTLSASQSGLDSVFSPGMTVCLDLDVVTNACYPDSVTLRMLEGAGTFAPQTGFGSFHTQHCFQPPSEGLYTLVFEAATVTGDVSIDTVDVTLAAQKSTFSPEVDISISQTNFVSICHPDTVCVPFSVSSVCDLAQLTTGGGAHINAADSSLCVYATDPIEFCVPLIAIDECGNKDSVEVCFVIETGTPTTITSPAVVDTVLCLPGFACVPVATSGGAPPVNITAIPPAVYVDGQTCLYVEEDGTYDVYTIVDNAECPPETSHTELTVQMNRPPQITGLPDTVVTVCRDGQYCFGPLEAIDPDGNLIAFVLWDGPGTLTGNTWCYIPPREEELNIVFRAEDDCRRAALDTLRVRFVNPSAPSITFGNASFDLCESGEVCVPFSITNSGQLPLSLTLDGPGTLNTVDSLVCVDVASSGSIELALTAEDLCGGGTTEPLTVNATINESPTVSCNGPETNFFCAGDQICFTYIVRDPGDNTANVSISGFGSVQQRAVSVDSEDEVCFTAATAGDYNVVIVATDGCGAADTCIVTGTIALNQPPRTVLRDTTVFLCAPEELCVPVSCEDPDGNLESCLVQGPPGGSYSAGSFCFTPDTAGVYSISATATDSCGLQDTRVRYVSVDYNAPPAVTVSGSTTRTAAPGDTICFDFNTADPDGNVSQISVLDNYLTYDDGQVCIEAVALSVTCARVVVTDACGLADTVTVCVEAGPGPNPQPKPQLPDTVITRTCTPAEICVPFIVDESFCEPQVITGINGATIDYSIPAVCLFVEEPGLYETGVVAADTCGAETGYVVIIVEPTDPPQIECPSPAEYFVCDDTTICVTITMSDPDGDIAAASASFGTAVLLSPSTLELCLPVDTAGTYTAVVTVTDSCGLADTCTAILSVQRNRPPAIDVPPPGSVTLCSGEEICVPVSCTDPDDNLTGCAPIDLGNASWDGESLCITPSVPGEYRWVFRAVDACGDETLDTLALLVQFNTAPVIQTEPAVVVNVCGPDTVCHPFLVADAENNIASVTTTRGVIRDGSVCVFLDGLVCFTITATDSCGLQHSRTVCITPNQTAGPNIEAPDSLDRRLCEPGDVCFDVALGPDSSDWIVDVSPVGDFDLGSGSVCFTPDTAGVYRLVISATNACDISTIDTTIVRVLYNSPPVVSGPNYVAATQCGTNPVCVGDIAFSDPDGNILRVVIDSGNGDIDPQTGVICFDPDSSGTYCFRVLIEDSCGLQATHTLCAVVTTNEPPAVNIEDLDQGTMHTGPTQICFDIVAEDNNFNQAISLQKIEGAGAFSGRDGTTVLIATHCFLADTSGCYRFIFEVTDACGAKARDTMTVCVNIEPPDSMFQICIDTVSSINGREATMKVRAKQAMEMGGFDFLICFDPTALTLMRAFADTALQGWEYFTYRVGDAASCPPCIEGQVRLLGIADMNNGNPHPPESAYLPRGPMAGLTFYVTPDRLFIGQCIPVDFCSYDCGDNTISDRSGDTLFVAIDGVPDTCVAGKSRPVLRRIDYCEGRLCIIPPPDDRGDMNLNGIANEVADAVLYSRFFIYGDGVLDPVNRESQVLASDVNCDGWTLTVADLVYMIRIITGDATEVDCPDVGVGVKIVPAAYAGRVILEERDGFVDVWLESDRDVGGVFVHLTSSGQERVHVEWGDQTEQLKRDAHQAGRDLRVLLQARQSGARLPGGMRKLFSFPTDGSGRWRILESQAATIEAEVIQLEVVSGADAVPSSFALLPNYPNPFNASTQIRFALGTASDWTLTIYNVLGQTVEEFQGASEAGEVTIQWDAKTLDGKSLASGIYFARLKAGQYSATRQMVLLK
ncbi:MAG: hypothetical protein Kow0074_14690 [Candidatus Zixiibacteriota bacterium]